ncbi:hypothetical protein LH464_09550 [Neorhizobium sp. T786]|uniref:hypothetical protein n=1 Tax=Pseudorhizobium xiangyangii TaxID=2883104 RepID=UPI001CFF76F5|nr:hypothetical protein [Neorhizobium xiangyangii]MCB5202716.1 hypothetical protein [Neorhizobium xiangyangii]
MVISPPSFLMPAVRQAWVRAGVDLDGPHNTAEFASRVADARVDGAVVDVQYDAPTLLRVVEVLEAFAVPTLFASSGRAAPGGGFTFSAEQGAINAIVRHLLGSDEKTIQ